METNSRYYRGDEPVSVVRLGSYDEKQARSAMEELLHPIGGLSFIRPGACVVIKANLVSAMKPETAATTHPVLLAALVEMLRERDCTVIVGDSPGGLYNAQALARVYRVTGMTELVPLGAELNSDFGQSEASFPEGRVLKSFTYTSYLDRADHIINFCKLKSHGMMGMSCAAKNMFGTVPGVIKPEYHFRFPKYEDFADMIVDLDEYFHPDLSIADAVVGMEGNGPTAGTPRELGYLLASRSPHTLDTLAAHLLGFTRSELPILDAAYRRGLAPDTVEGLTVLGNTDFSVIEDFERVVERRSLQFSGDGKSPVKRAFGKLAGWVLKTRPVLKKELCVGCGVCRDICPAKAITVKDKRAVIDRSACIRCFCCQEFCPRSAMKVHRNPLSRLFHSEKRK